VEGKVITYLKTIRAERGRRYFGSFAMLYVNLQKLASWSTISNAIMLTLKQKYFIPKLAVAKSASLPVLLAVIMLASAVVPPLVRADQFDAQIQALQQQNASTQSNLAQLGSEATSLADEVNKLQAQINALQAQINANQAKSDDLKKQIAAAEDELAKQKKVLGENIRAMYVEGQISTLEMLASSKDLSDFVDKQQYRSSVQDKIKTTLDKITALKVQLKDDQQQVDALLKDEQTMNNQLSGQRAYQSSLLAMNQQQQDALNQQIQANNTQVASLRAAQAAANRKLGGSNVEAGDPGHGGYPGYLDQAGKDTLSDPWGMFNRECVSYTAWKVYQTFGHMPYWGGHGNANQWPASAVADGISTGTTPRAHSVAIYTGGYYGHAMWVEGVSGDYIHVSQYNYDLAGHYSEMTINGSGLTYIYFN
jgi:peptidoglycan hydrolase CwlO-like protein